MVNELLGMYESKSTEAQSLRAFEAELQNILKTWDQMLAKSIEANKALEAEGTTGEALAKEITDTQLSEKETITQEAIDALRSIGRKSVNAFTSGDIKKAEPFARRMWKELGVKSTFFRNWFGDWRANDTKTTVKTVEIIETIIPYDIQPKDIGIILRNKLKNKELFRGTVKNTDTGYNIQIGAFGYNDTFTYAQRELRKKGVSNEEALRRINALVKIDELIQNAVLFDTEVISDKDNPNRSLMHVFYVVANVCGIEELIKIKVDELESPTNPIKRFYNLNDFEIINKKPLVVNWDLNPSTDTSGGKDKVLAPISISDLFQLVKTYDKEFNPKEASKVVNADGTPKVVYHGTNKNFNTFESRDGVYWFSESYDYAESMAEERGGNTVMQVYLNIKNPLHVKLPEGKFSDPTYEKPIIAKAKAEGYDGVIFETDTDNELVYDKFYVAFEKGQIKSVTDNIGTFDKGDEDIQFSDKNSDESNSIKQQLMLNQDKLNAMGVIASINTSKNFKNAKDAHDWAIKQLKQSGYKVDRYGFGTVIFDEKRTKNGLQYIKTKAEYTAYALIPKVIKRGIVIGEHPNHKDRGYGTITFAAPVEIDGIRGNMAVVVRIEGKNYYKLHRVFLPDGSLFEYKKESIAETAAATTSVVDTPTDNASNKSIYNSPEKNNKQIVNNEKVQMSEKNTAPSVYDLVGEHKTLKKRYKELEADFENYKERVKLDRTLTKGKLINPKQLEAVARFL